MGGPEDITAEMLEAESDRLQLRTSNSRGKTQQQARFLPSKTISPTTKLHKMYNLKNIDTAREGMTPQPTREEQKIHVWVERPVSWGPADIPRNNPAF